MAKDLGDGLGAAVGRMLRKPVEKAGEKLKAAASEVIDEKIKEAGGPGGIAKEALKSLIPGFGGGKNLGDGVGKGRRMPVQQSVDVGAPLQTVYNQFTQFEEWPKFMHRVTSVSQEDETHVAFKAKIWGVSKQFQAEIDEQRPDERIKWHVVEGLSHKGAATFHELAPRLTRIEVNVDVEPGSLIEKFARGARHVKRAMRADLHRFKAYIMMNEAESGAWRETIEDAEVKRSSSGHDRGRNAAARARARLRRPARPAGAAGPPRTVRRAPAAATEATRPRVRARVVARSGRGPDGLACPRRLGPRGDQGAAPRASPARAASGRPD
jgi:uncharacterized membrane protein